MGMNDFDDLADLLGPAADSPRAQVVVDPAPATVAAVAGASGGGVSYDGSNAIDQLAFWNPSIQSADSEIIPEKSRLDARVRDTLRNDAYVAGGAAIWKDAIVGGRYMLNAKPETKVLWGAADDIWEAEFQEEVETKFNLWAESPQNWPDASRHNTLSQIVRLGIGTTIQGGEVLGLASWIDDGRMFRSALQMVDADRLSDPRDRFMLDTNIRGGIERDLRGAAIAYHIRNTHPSEGPFFNFRASGLPQWVRVPARKKWGRQVVLHLFEQMRPDQTRGISGMVAALTEMRMLKHFRKTELQRAVIAATYAASIESELPSGDVLAAMGGVIESGDNPSVVWSNDYLEMVNGWSSGAKNIHMDGAKIPQLPPGSALKIQNPGASSPVGAAFEMSLLRHVAAALGLSYEQFSRDYTNTNYSSARASIGEMQKSAASLKSMVADPIANFVYRLWLEEAVNYNLLETLKRRNVPRFYDGQNAEAYSSAEWIGAGNGQIDPLKETQAARMRIQSGLSTKEIEIAKMSGGDYRKVARQIARERKMDEALGNPSIYDVEASPADNALSGTNRGAKKPAAEAFDLEEGEAA